VIKKPLIIPFLITLIFSTFSPITIHSANAATVGTGPCISTVSSDTGVTATTSDNYCVVSFKSTAATTTWTVPSGIYFVDVLVVAGGGAGGTANGGAGGGGGGGQVSVQSNKSVSGVVTIQVGSGGSPGSNSNTRGNDGGQSAFVLSASDSITARGGSAGASVAAALNVGTPSSNGFNGGGGSTWADSKTAGSTGVGGYSGGNANSDGITADNQAAGGGGGSGGVGVNATPANGGAGGAGTANSFTGTSVTYGGGGGGAKRNSSAGSAGTASGGGGAGGKNTVGSNGGTNTGGGGGGAGESDGVGALVGSSGGSGGSGIVVVKYLPITITTITNKLSSRNSTTASATVSSGSLSYSASGACSVNSSTGAVTFTSTGSCTITATASSSPSTTASTTFQIVPNITQKLISRTGIQPNALSSYIPPPYLSTSETYTVTSCVSIVGATGADLLSSTNLSFSLASLLVSPGVITDTGAGKSYTITGTLAQVQAAFSIFKLNSSSGRIMAANSGSIYLRARTNLVVDSATDTGCIDYNDARITLYQYTSDQLRRKNVPQKSGSTP
jgi:hypothetical protein